MERFRDMTIQALMGRYSFRLTRAGTLFVRGIKTKFSCDGAYITAPAGFDIDVMTILICATAKEGGKVVVWVKWPRPK